MNISLGQTRSVSRRELLALSLAGASVAACSLSSTSQAQSPAASTSTAPMIDAPVPNDTSFARALTCGPSPIRSV